MYFFYFVILVSCFVFGGNPLSIFFLYHSGDSIYADLFFASTESVLPGNERALHTMSVKDWVGSITFAKPLKIFTIEIANFTDLEEARKQTRNVSHTISIPVRLERVNQQYSIRVGSSTREDDLQPFLDIIKANGYPQASLIVLSDLKNNVILELSPRVEIKRKDQKKQLDLKQKNQVGTGRIELPYVEEKILEMREGPAARPSYEGDYYNGKAWEAYRAGNFEQAIAFFKFAETFMETELDAKLGLAYSYSEQEKTEEVLSLCDELVKEKFKRKEVAGILVKIKRYDRALDVCDEALLTDRFNADFLTLKTNILVQKKEFSEAGKFLADIPSEKKSFDLLRYEANIDVWAKKYDRAIEKYQKLMYQFPEDNDLWLKYVRVVTRAKKWLLLSDILEEGVGRVEITDENRPFLIEAYLGLGEPEKAFELWEGMDINANDWDKIFLTIVDGYLSFGKLKDAIQILKKVLSTKKKDAHFMERLAVYYFYSGMHEKGFEIIGRVQSASQSQRDSLKVTEAELFSFIKQYESALAVLQAGDLSDRSDSRAEMIELECYYGLGQDDLCLQKTQSLLPNIAEEDTIRKAKIISLSILSMIRMGLYEEAGKYIEILKDTKRGFYGPAMLTVLLKNATWQLTENDASIQTLGRVLSEYAHDTEMSIPQLLDDEALYGQSRILALSILHAWRIADELSSHKNLDVIVQLAKAEYKAGNYQRSLELFKKVYERDGGDVHKLGMVECFLGLEEFEMAGNLFDEIDVLSLADEEVPRYFEGLIRLGRDNTSFWEAFSLISEDIAGTTAMKSISLIANIQHGDDETANNAIERYLTGHRYDTSIFRLIMERVGYFEKGKKGRYYTFAKNWLQKATELLPEDTGLRYQYAELLVSHTEYESAIEQYLRLHELDANIYETSKCLARLYSWTNNFEEGLKWYNEYVTLHPADFAGRHEIARVYGWALRQKEANEVYKKLHEDFPDNDKLYLEWQAKRSRWLGQKRRAIHFYEKLTELQQDDPEILFDLGQLYSQRNFSGKAEHTYRKLLVYEPTHNRASFSADSEKWRRKQVLGAKQTYIHQKGTGDEFENFEITRQRTDLNYAPVRLSEAMDLSFSVGHTLFDFIKQTASMAEHAALKIDKDFENGITAYVNGEFSTYTENNHETIQFETGIHYDVFEKFDTTLVGGREDVLENFNNLNNRRSRYFAAGRSVWEVNRHFDTFAQIKQYWYNDGNNGLEYSASLGYKFLVYPKILRFSLEFFSFDVHRDVDEYWSPDSYKKYSASLSWRHYVGKEHFVGAPVLFYEVSMKQGVDSDSIDFTEPAFVFGWDDKRRFDIGLEIKPIRSAVYDEERMFLFLNVRF
ncbi:MAG: hypothetical protein MRJ65_03855 [Candidatus Brocadiaceae bacterium]|nr:hypothetical protein [Candidatus Brocadiaceae bacterium]